jgi:hypothetical protein
MVFRCVNYLDDFLNLFRGRRQQTPFNPNEFGLAYCRCDSELTGVQASLLSQPPELFAQGVTDRTEVDNRKVGSRL